MATIRNYLCFSLFLFIWGCAPEEKNNPTIDNNNIDSSFIQNATDAAIEKEGKQEIDHIKNHMSDSSAIELFCLYSVPDKYSDFHTSEIFKGFPVLSRNVLLHKEQDEFISVFNKILHYDDSIKHKCFTVQYAIRVWKYDSTFSDIVISEKCGIAKLYENKDWDISHRCFIDFSKIKRYFDISDKR